MAWGNFFVISMCLSYFMQAVAALLFFIGVRFFLDHEWVLFIGVYISFNFIFEGKSWLDDWSSEEKIKLFDEDVKQEFFKNHPYIKNKQLTDSDSG